MERTKLNDRKLPNYTKGEEISRDLAIKIAIKRSNSTLNPYEYF